MSETPGSYRVDYDPKVKEQIIAIKEAAIEAGRLREYVEILEQAVHFMRTDPHGWGDPEFRSKFVNGLYCHAMRWPVSFRYVIYEDVHGVVLLSLRQVAAFK